MNFAALVLRISKVTERFPRFHKIARRAYCVFRPGIRFQTEAAFKDYQDIFVLKIGANDGITNDSLATLLLADARYRGLLVEPMPMYAAMLRANYGKCGRFAIEQAAVAASSGTTNMYYVDENALKGIGLGNLDWVRGVASLDRLHVLKHLSPELHSAVKETSVESLTVNALLSRHNIQKIDLLHIDCEGFDYVILRQFDFTTLRPRIVLFEQKHLTAPDRQAAKTMMELAGYKVEEMETDIFCLAVS
ncbi:MAG TPA: FkbM family methyltransferase [Candidatus Udaeobacter sp.]|jgi:FkbM family methyltransferase